MPPQIILDHGVYWYAILEEFHYLCHLCQLHTLSRATSSGHWQNPKWGIHHSERMWRRFVATNYKTLSCPFCHVSYLNRTKCNRFTYSNKIFEESNKKMCLWNIQSHLSYCGIAADYGCCTTAHASHIHAESFPNSGRKKNTAYMKGDTTSEL